MFYNILSIYRVNILHVMQFNIYLCSEQIGVVKLLQ